MRCTGDNSIQPYKNSPAKHTVKSSPIRGYSTAVYAIPCDDQKKNRNLGKLKRINYRNIDKRSRTAFAQTTSQAPGKQAGGQYARTRQQILSALALHRPGYAPTTRAQKKHNAPRHDTPHYKTPCPGPAYSTARPVRGFQGHNKCHQKQ